MFNVPNAPKSFAAVEHLLERESIEKFQAESLKICSGCYETFTDACTNVNCKLTTIEKSPSFLKFSMKAQVESILASEANFNFHPLESLEQNLSLSRIENADWYHHVAVGQKSNFITLLMNVHGVSISKSSDSSLWIFTVVFLFAFENVYYLCVILFLVYHKRNRSCRQI